MKDFLPLGYEIRTEGANDHYGDSTKLAGYYNGRLIVKSSYISIYGYRACLRKVKYGIKQHYKYGIDRGGK